MSKIKVVHILNTGKFSGAENVVLTLMEEMRQQVDATYVSLDGEIEEILRKNNLPYYGLETLNVKKLKKAISNLQPDIIHAHDFTAGVIASLSTFTIPIINHLHNNAPWIKSLGPRSLLYALSCLRYKKILTVSPAVLQEFIFGNFFSSKSLVVGNPMNLEKIRKLTREKVLDEQFDLVFLGRLTPQKKPILFLEIVRELKMQYPDIKAVMVGDGELRKEVEEKIKDLQLAENVRLVGFQVNPYIYLSASKMMCMPSAWEGFGLAAVEALTLGVPVIASPVGGLKDIVRPDCGALCEDKGEFVAEISNLLSSGEKLARKSLQAHKRANDFDNLEAYTDSMLALYSQLL
ncbi:glycosyltransferase [Streptococcus oricebi]|uniref:Glycosyltransferase n=1 Tax=Streptococcus oricebi TaxID=1547447 RepID=A0ABS5B7H0_9STRE|nr:glycosyltransferase [Streptococcus oricebi]MBP2623959.1 hypothetical protein [Streptococcus oricebi]